MRIDKYIWAIRVAKTRSIANSLCRDGKVEIGGKVKSARAIKPGETIVVRKGAVFYSYKVVVFLEVGWGCTCSRLCSRRNSKEQLDKLEMIRLANIDRPKGLGRPKKVEEIGPKHR